MGLTLVDSSVWIDLLNDIDTRQVARLRQLAENKVRIAIGDLVLVEVLQGARHERRVREALHLFSAYEHLIIAGQQVAIAAAHHYRHLRSLGVTPRKTIDTLIATRCILDDLSLLYADRDFQPFVEHLGLRSALDDTGLN